MVWESLCRAGPLQAEGTLEALPRGVVSQRWEQSPSSRPGRAQTGPQRVPVGHPLVPSKHHVLPASSAAGWHRRCRPQAGLCRRSWMATVGAPWESLVVEKLLSASQAVTPGASSSSTAPDQLLLAGGAADPRRRKWLFGRTLHPLKCQGQAGRAPGPLAVGTGPRLPPGFPPRIGRATSV